MKRTTPLFLFCILLLTISTVNAQKGPDAPLKVRINHIAVYVYDLEKSRDFYENIVQLKRIPEPFKDGLHEWFSVGEPAQLHLIKGAKEITEHSKNGHICFSVPVIDDFIQNLKKNNISYTNWKGDSDQPTVRVDGVKQIYFKDPDGNWIEINDDHR
ncbi:MAG: glyoxalase [Sphingobacteriales bacterium]|nr:glyoxalase [Sphingobacteriales bacterium]